VWNQVDYTVYRSYSPRFVAEFGWQGPPAWSTLRRALSDEPLTPESPGMLVHQKAMEGDKKLGLGLVAHLPIPDDMDAWHWAMSLNQARAIRPGVEYFRSLSPHCAGSVVWQLNDCWPVVSWAAVDGDGRRKPLFYALRHAHADRLVTVQPSASGLRVALVNDAASTWSGTLDVRRLTYDGKALAACGVEVSIPAYGTSVVDLPPDVCLPGVAGEELLVAELDGLRGTWFFAEDRDSALPAPDLRGAVTQSDTGYVVTVTAGSLARDVALLVDKVAPDAAVDDMLATLLPGESITWHVTTTADVDPDAFLAPTVLRTANELVQ
jgi:beta-mannosidase